MNIEEIVQLKEIEERANALSFDRRLTEENEVVTDLKILITSAFIDETKSILLRQLEQVSFVSLYSRTEEQLRRDFNDGKRQLLSLIRNVSTTITHRPETLKRNALNNANAGDKRKKSRINVVLSVVKDWVIPILGLILGSMGCYELHMANNIKNELRNELKSEIKAELQQEVSQMVKQEVQQRVDNQIIINNK